jgi:flagellar motor component MotA
MMFKGFAVLALGVFLGLTFVSVSFDAGAGFFVLSLATLGVGAGFVFLVSIPQGFLESTWAPVCEALPGSAEALAREIDSIATVIRQDGLLALEGKRRELRSPELRFFLKRIMDGFESADLLPLIRNRSSRRLEMIEEAECAVIRFCGFFVQAGLVQSLILISAVLLGGARSRDAIGVSHALFPFVLALTGQILIEAGVRGMLDRKRSEGRLYFSVLEEGVAGVQRGENPELLREKIASRISPGFRWDERVP